MESDPVAQEGNDAVLRALGAALDALGVREYGVCAGARNAPIIAALVQRGAKVRHFADERSAAFFMLGRIMEARRPAAVLTTSGTAAAELLPAIVEAHYQAMPLVAITADRPSRYAGSGAPQAIEQAGLFGGYARYHDLDASDARAKWAPANDLGIARPLHLNVRLEEALGRSQSATDPTANDVVPDALEGDLSAADRQRWDAFWASDDELLVLAAGLHPADVPAARDFLVALGAPVMPEATANLHAISELHPLLLRGGEKSLRRCAARRVLRLGAVPSWRWWRDLDSREDVRVLNVTRAPFRGLARSRNVDTVPWAILRNAGSVARPEAPEKRDGDYLLEGLLESHPRSEPAWMRHVSRLIGGSARVFLGNSLPIREWNLAADIPRPGTTFFANRGANGIDGLVSTWLGISADAAEAWCIVGDLSALHDAGAPWILPQLPVARRRLVVLNNGGGKIFSRVAWLKPMSPEGMRVMENPHGISFEPWAKLWGLKYRLFTDPREVRDDNAACAVWEIRPDPGETDAFWSAWG